MEISKRWGDRVTAKIAQGERSNNEPMGQDMPYFRFITPVKLTSDFTETNGIHSATAVKLRFNSDEKKYEEFGGTADQTITVYWFVSGDAPFSTGDIVYAIKRRFWEIIGGGASPVGELGWGRPLSSMSPLNGAMVTKARTYPDSSIDQYRRDIVYLGEEWENCIVREKTPITYLPALPLRQLPYLVWATQASEGLAKLGVVSPNYLSPAVKVELNTSSSYFSMVLSPDQSKYTITWRDNTSVTPRMRYHIDFMSSRQMTLQSGATSQTIELTLPDLFCLYAIPIDANGYADPDYAYSHALFIDPSPMRPVEILKMSVTGGDDSDNPVNLDAYIGGVTTRFVTVSMSPSGTLFPALASGVLFDLFTIEYRVDSNDWKAWNSGNAGSNTNIRIGENEEIQYDVPFELSLHLTSRTTGRTQYTESMGWYIVTE